MKESDLAEYIISYLEQDGYICYKEVSMRGKGGNARSDCYFVKGAETIAVETKMSMTLTVIQQADKWKTHASRVFVCVPTVSKKGWRARKFSIKICEALGIGVFEYGSNGIKKSVDAKINKNTKLPPLYEQQKNSVAGNAEGQFYTSFKNTVNELNNFMGDKVEYNFNDLVSEINHHYKTTTSAKSSIKKMIEQDVIKGYFLIKKDKDIYIVVK